MSEDDGLIHALVLDGKGGGRAVDWDGARAWRREQGVLWVHLDRAAPEARAWLTEESGLDTVIAEALLEEDVRPRVLPVGDALLINMRGINFNEGEAPDDMVSIRMWIEPSRIITSRHRRIRAVSDVRETLDSGRGPLRPGDFLLRVADLITDRMGPTIAGLEDQVDALETEVLTAGRAELRGKLSALRSMAISLRRYLAPQRDVMTRLASEAASWLDAADKIRLREVADRTMRYVEDLDAARERALVTQDELNSRVNEQMNKTMYVLTVVAAILLPASLITGLFGINVGGMPGIEAAWAFYGVIGLMVVFGLIQFVLFRWLRWI